MANLELLKKKCGEQHFKKLEALNNSVLLDFVAKYAEECEPDSVFVCTDSEADAILMRKMAVDKGEEIPLNIDGHTIHFDGMTDQGRDPKNTKFLYEKGKELEGLTGMDREEGNAEIHGLLKGMMKGRQMLVLFFSLGPVDSPFYIPAVQLTDSYYVAHSEIILYRRGYEGFKKAKPSTFFKVVHATGETENAISKNIDKRRIYIDLKTETVYSVNTQYAGNTVGFKKLALRLAIQKASKEGWLAEHMFLMGVKGPWGRKSYFSGAYPSMCGKTSTAMVEGETIVGDDLAYLRNVNGTAMAANVEKGIFGIIQDINPNGDPLIWKVLDTPGDVIFGNVLDDNGIPRWLGDGRENPANGTNFSGEWTHVKKDEKGNPIPYAHKNARYSISLENLKNCDSAINDKKGVKLQGIVFGGRDSDTWVPVRESFDWNHGVLAMGASIESETTAATIGKEGERVFNIMSNMEFLSISIPKYLEDYLEFGKGLHKAPRIFACNYFLRDMKTGKWLNGVKDKRVWLKWMELRSHNEVDAIKSPSGFIPKYEDLKKLFTKVMKKDYTIADYNSQFMIRVPQNIAKIDRILEIYTNKIHGTPKILFDVLREEKERFVALKLKSGDFVNPDKL
ncbi:MAG: phosphoenolpyruvate carboxykinase (GTP) [bacterium]